MCIFTWFGIKYVSSTSLFRTLFGPARLTQFMGDQIKYMYGALRVHIFVS